MEGLIEQIYLLVRQFKDDLGKWGDVILIVLAITTVAGIITTVFVLWS